MNPGVLSQQGQSTFYSGAVAFKDFEVFVFEKCLFELEGRGQGIHQ